MLTDEFETDLREALDRCAAGVPADLATRLRGHDYHPRGNRRYLVVTLVTVVVVAISTVAIALQARQGRTSRALGGQPSSWRLVSDVGQLWQASAPGSLQSGVELACPTVSTCLARVMPAPGGPVSGPIQIEVTHDGGATWQRSTLPSDITQASGQFGAIDCVDANTCLTLAANSSDDYVLVETTDGGATWEELPGPPELATAFAVSAISCTSATACVLIGGFAVGTPEVGSNAAEITTDGGLTWTQSDMPSESGVLQCFADGRCITASSYSIDGGLTWTAAQLPPTQLPAPGTIVPAGGVVWSMSCGDSDDCVALTFIGNVLSTTDGGLSWDLQTPSGPGSGLAVTCASGAGCWAAGATEPGPGATWPTQLGSPTEPVLDSTVDQGSSWQPAELPSGLDISAVGEASCPTATACYAIASGTNGLVLLSYGT